MVKCKCGCGEIPNEGKCFIRGHYSRTPEAKKMYEKMRQVVPPPNPEGKCQCGCGKITPKYTRNRASRGEAKGQHHKFLRGHAAAKGPESHKWKGGRFVNGYGYVEVYMPDHPFCNGRGYVLEHRLVLEKKLGRLLDPEERAHHINGKLTDNRPENLVALSRVEHARIHATALRFWEKRHPGKSSQVKSKAGKKGATARWAKKK
jgi:hypothetical protein